MPIRDEKSGAVWSRLTPRGKINGCPLLVPTPYLHESHRVLASFLYIPSYSASVDDESWLAQRRI